MKKMVNVAAGLLVRAPTSFQKLYMSKCTPEERHILINAMQYTPAQLGLLYDGGDPKEMEALKKKDLETIAHYNEIRLKREKDLAEHLAWKKKHDGEVTKVNHDTEQQKHEKQWKQAVARGIA